MHAGAFIPEIPPNAAMFVVHATSPSGRVPELYPQQPKAPLTLKVRSVATGFSEMCAGSWPAAPAYPLHAADASGITTLRPAAWMFMFAVQSRRKGLGLEDGVGLLLAVWLADPVMLGVVGGVRDTDGVMLGVAVIDGVVVDDAVALLVAVTVANDVGVMVNEGVGDCREPSHGPLMRGEQGARARERNIYGDEGCAKRAQMRMDSLGGLNACACACTCIGFDFLRYSSATTDTNDSLSLVTPQAHSAN